MDDIYKEVYFNVYCETCQHKSISEEEDPCYACLQEPVNLYSHKPVKWEEKK